MIAVENLIHGLTARFWALLLVRSAFPCKRAGARTTNRLKPALRTGGTGRTFELRQAFDVGGQVAKGFGVSPKGSEG